MKVKRSTAAEKATGIVTKLQMRFVALPNQITI